MKILSALTFTQAGREITEGRQAELMALFASLQWTEHVKGAVFSFATGELIRAALESLPGGAMTHFADSHLMAPFGLVAIRRTGFKGGFVNIYLADTGTAAIVLASEFVPTAVSGRIAA